MSLSLRTGTVLRRHIIRPLSFIKRTTPACATKRYLTDTRNESATRENKQPIQSKSPLTPIGVDAALAMTSGGPAPKPKIFDEFSLHDRVALVSGGDRGIGLEAALALCEAGARAVYCLDLPQSPSPQFEKTSEYVNRMDKDSITGPRRLKYISADVRDQEKLWKIGEDIGNREGRMDVCVAAAGMAKPSTDCLDYPAQEFQDVHDVNVKGVLFTAQATGRQMVKFGNGGSIILIGSISGSITNRDQGWISYNSSKSAVLQMARSMACELGPRRIRVNTLSPGYIHTELLEAYINQQPHLIEKWSDLNPLGRLGRPDELRGVITWLASDASSYCTGSDILVSGGVHAW